MSRQEQLPSQEAPAIDIFPEDIAWEVYRLTKQDRPDLQPLAYDRLNRLETEYKRQAGISEDELQQYDKGNIRKSFKYMLSGLGGMALGHRYNLPEVYSLSFIWTAGVATIFAKKYFHTDSYPHPKAKKAAEYLEQITSTHPGRSKEDKNS